MKNNLRHVIKRKENANPFTIVELLVVISIIAILASMLLPALGKAKETAKAINCTSNMKQMSTGIAMYINDYGWMMPRSSGSKSWYNNDDGLLIPYLGFESKYKVGEITATGRHPYACPGVPDTAATEDSYAPGPTFEHCTIGYNTKMEATPYMLKGPAFINPSRHFLLADAFGDRVSKTTMLSVFGEISLRHSNAANIIYTDLHVEARKRGTYNTLTTATPFWRAGADYQNVKD
jgi:prepilin-type processing-associated H-X9-DG protein